MNNTAVSSDAKKYELMVIINSDLGEVAIKKRLEAIRSQIVAFPAEIFHEEVWGLRDLAYPIKKHDQGCYALFDFETDPSALKELDATLRLEPEVLRHLIMVLPGSYQPKDYSIVEEEVTPETKETEMKKTPAFNKPKGEMKPQETAKEKPAASSETVAEKAPKNPKDKNPKASLENVDAKLQSILENPDLNF